MKITCSLHIDAPPERVFAAASDVRRAPEFINAITKIEVLTPGEVGAGTRFRETRVMFGKEATEEMTFAVFDPPRSYTMTADSHGCFYESVFAFTPERGGTRLDFSFRGEPKTTGMKILSAVMLPLLKGTMIKTMRRDLDDLKAYVESGGDLR